MTVARLVVRHFGRDVGTITLTASEALSFEYADSWLSGDGFALATSLPLRAGVNDAAFFRNLLPEAGARERIAKTAGISVDNDFAFLRIFGADCAGSLEITDPNAKPLATAGDILPLTGEDGAKLATKSGFASYFRPENRLRLSLAGAQNKLAVIRTKAGLAVPLDGRPSTHILKLPNPDYKGLVENEAVMLSVASSIGLPVVEHEAIILGDTNMLLIGRYDRVVAEDGTVARLHQQDLCQATGLPPHIKHESEGGPSLNTVFNLVRDEVADPLTAAVSMLDWVVFNVLVHNADAHAKNISILRTPDGRQNLAPFYDLVCTGAYALDHRMAMSVGGQFDPGEIAKKNWVQLASEIGIGKSLVLKVVEEMATRVSCILDEKVEALSVRLGGLPRRQQLERTVKRRLKKTLFLLS